MAGTSSQTTAKCSTQPSETMFPVRCAWAARDLQRQVGPQFCRSRATPARVPTVTSARRSFEEQTNLRHGFRAAVAGRQRGANHQDEALAAHEKLQCDQISLCLDSLS